MVIDAHAHACGKYLKEKDIIEYLDSHGIDKVILCSGEQGSRINYYMPDLSKMFSKDNFVYLFNRFIFVMTRLVGLPTQVGKGNNYVFRLSQKSPERILNAYWVNPCEADCMKSLDLFYQKCGFVMVKLHQCWHNYNIDSEMCRKIYIWAAEKEIPVFVHLRSKEQVKKFIKVTNYYKNTIFIVAHMIGYDIINRFSKRDNVYFDLSSPQVYSEKLLNKAVKNSGSSRLILGSDTPYGVNNIEKIKKMLLRMNIGSEEMDNICSNNIKRLINI